jgi:hypothetical protein
MDHKLYKKIDNYLAWAAFAVAATVFMMTVEPTASFWDAGERLSASFKLQVMHPPGAPLYQMMARIFSLFSLGDTAKVAYWINAMSVFFGALTVSFVFRTITILAKKLIANTVDVTREKAIAIFGSGFVGAMALTFSDSFWFTAVEAEVYVTSLFMTAFVFWSILKWEASAHQKDSLKWLVLIAYIIGLSIGVHMLNLLAIPAIVLVYYFKKYEPTPKGIIITGIISLALLGFIMSVLIPGLLTIDWWFEKFFVNTLRLPFHSGTLAFFIFLIGSIIFGLYFTHKHKKVVLNTIILAFTFIVIGYSSFFMLVIRSNAHVPINENAPKDALAMKAYLGREQYGSWPLLHGPYYNSPMIDARDGNPVYGKNRETKRYEVINPRIGVEPVYDPEFTTVFPRMHSSRPEIHVSGYKNWGNVKGRPIRFTGPDGNPEVIEKPTFGENLRFFFAYQMGHMYWRYFMWNFAGRQNDIQGHGSPVEGNWLSGIKFLDSARLGPQDNLPDSMTSNRGYNRYFMLPLLLGIIGMLFQLRRRPNDTLVVALLFFMTGLAIIIYLNQTPYQPRERDYSYIGSFYAFSIWIGLGVLSIYNFLSKKLNGQLAGITAIVIALLAAPAIMAKENWDDHDRSGRYMTRDVAINYLESCAPNAIIFTNGDNDTFPLWYVQEVEGIRTDVKVVNLSLLNTDWYINNMMRRKTYDADPVPFSMEPKQYRDGTRDYVYMVENPNLTGHQDLRSIVQFVGSDEQRTRIRTSRGFEDYIPTKKFRLAVDPEKVLANGTVAPEDAHLIVPAIEWTIDEFGLQKNQLMVLDFLATNNWERPVYFAITTGGESYMGLEEYFQLEGMAYRLVPIRTPDLEGQPGRINTRILYDNIMNKFLWGNIDDPKVYLNEDNRRLTVNFRNIMQRLAHALIEEEKNDSAIAVLDRAMELMPESQVPFNYFNLLLAEAYYYADEYEKAGAITERLVELYSQDLAYYFSITGPRASFLDRNKQEALAILQRIQFLADAFDQGEISEKAKKGFDTYYQLFLQGF